MGDQVREAGKQYRRRAAGPVANPGMTALDTIPLS